MDRTPQHSVTTLEPSVNQCTLPEQDVQSFGEWMDSELELLEAQFAGFATNHTRLVSLSREGR